jgi:hypothetical protein
MGLSKLGFKVSTLDPGIYCGQGMIIFTYMDDTLFFLPDLKVIETVINGLEELGSGD